jgi:hypothetical protein
MEKICLENIGYDLWQNNFREKWRALISGNSTRTYAYYKIIIFLVALLGFLQILIKVFPDLIEFIRK